MEGGVRLGWRVEFGWDGGWLAVGWRDGTVVGWRVGMGQTKVQTVWTLL